MKLTIFAAPGGIGRHAAAVGWLREHADQG